MSDRASYAIVMAVGVVCGSGRLKQVKCSIIRMGERQWLSTRSNKWTKCFILLVHDNPFGGLGVYCRVLFGTSVGVGVYDRVLFGTRSTIVDRRRNQND